VPAWLSGKESNLHRVGNSDLSYH